MAKIPICSICTLISTVLLVFFGLCFLLGGLITLSIFPGLYLNGIKENKIIEPSSQAYDQWVEPTIPIYMKFYFFNCTNIEDFLGGEDKPVLEERGPYVFREHRRKVNISHERENFVAYFQDKWWHFDENLSSGSLDDVISTINVPVFTAAYKARFYITLQRLILSEAMKSHGAKLSVAKTVREFLFEGYRDPIIDFARNMTNFTGVEVPFDKFGWFYERNHSLDGLYVINNGQEDINNVGYIESWKNMSTVPFFGKYCNYINGTAADVFPPFMYEDTQLQFFASDLCRSLTFVFDKDVEVDLVKARRFIPKPNLMDSGELEPSNQCFCTGECTLPGVLNISSCRDGAPAFISFPHFLDGDRYYRDNVIGMNPDREKHQFIMDIQPDIGIPANVNGRFQINILVERVDMELFQHFKTRTFFPMLWFEQSAKIDEKTADKLIFVTQNLKSYVKAGAFSMIAVGLFFIAIAFAIIIQRAIKNEKAKQQTSQGKTYELAPTKDTTAEKDTEKAVDAEKMKAPEQ